MAIYARENGQGMSFPMGVAAEPALTQKPKAITVRPVLSAVDATQVDGAPDNEPPTTPSARPTLTRVK